MAIRCYGVAVTTATTKAYKHILVIVDGFSKFVWLYPTKSTTTKEVLNKLAEDVR